jgi:hypothetical protein
MLALGRDEADALNSAARRQLRDIGALRGPTVRSGGVEWQAGDELRVLRRHPLFGPAAGGATGTVTAVDPAASTVTIRWRAGTTAVHTGDLARAPVSHAYAVTPGWLRTGAGGPLLCLGEPGDHRLPAGRATTLYIVAHPAASRDPPAVAAPMAWRTAALGAAADARPTRTVLAAIGPRPPDEEQRRSWARAATAIEAYRDRWGLPDDPDVLDLRPRTLSEPFLRADRLRVHAACRSFAATRVVGRGLEAGL